jgi:broad specificity phosphatase PhoE
VARLIRVRHSIPEPEPGLAPSEWRLSESGFSRIPALARLLGPYLPAALLSNSEAKAAHTAPLVGRDLGMAVRCCEGLREHRRSSSDRTSQARFQAAITLLFERTTQRVFGLESADAACARFEQAIGSVLKAFPAGNVAAVTHGTVLSLFVGRCVAGIDAHRLWRRLGMPAAVVLHRETQKLEAIIAEVA